MWGEGNDSCWPYDVSGTENHQVDMSLKTRNSAPRVVECKALDIEAMAPYLVFGLIKIIYTHWICLDPKGQDL